MRRRKGEGVVAEEFGRSVGAFLLDLCTSVGIKMIVQMMTCWKIVNVSIFV